MLVDGGFKGGSEGSEQGGDVHSVDGEKVE